MSGPLAAAFWGGVGGVSLLLGCVIALWTHVSRRVIAAIMAIGGGVLISSVAFELMDQAYSQGGFTAAAGGLALGSILYFIADWLVSRGGGKNRKRSDQQPDDQGSGWAIAIGALMDGIPESAAIGISLLAGGSVGWVMVIAVFLSNIPESMSSAVGMKKAGRSTRYIFLLWLGVVAISALSSWAGYVLLADAAPALVAALQACAAGAILTMLASTMMPEAFQEGGSWVGVVTALGFLTAFALSKYEERSEQHAPSTAAVHHAPASGHH
jgi:zinc transporter, ZIP family